MTPASDLSDTVVVFDLDDTLYPEEAYVRSGIAAACRLAADLYGIDHAPGLLTLRDEGQRDWLTALCTLLPPAPGIREALLWAYRLHPPTIALAPEVRAIVDLAIGKARATAILTDGRSITQRQKLRALGLCSLPAYISDEYGNRDKPDFPSNRYLYVADNPAKDFVTPKALGWRTVGVIGQAGRIHARELDLPSTYSPDLWISSLDQLPDARF
jgi:putative hydrolase of the HAD superfamily